MVLDDVTIEIWVEKKSRFGLGGLFVVGLDSTSRSSNTIPDIAHLASCELINSLFLYTCCRKERGVGGEEGAEDFVVKD